MKQALVTRPTTRAQILAVLEGLGVGPEDPFMVSAVPKGHGDPSAPGAGQARRGDPATSKAAAAGAWPRTGTQRMKILEQIVIAGDRGLTGEEASQRSGVEYRSATPRIGELKAEGWIVTNGHTRPGTHGAEQAVLVATPDAVDRLRVP